MGDRRGAAWQCGVDRRGDVQWMTAAAASCTRRRHTAKRRADGWVPAVGEPARAAEDDDRVTRRGRRRRHRGDRRRRTRVRASARSSGQARAGAQASLESQGFDRAGSRRASSGDPSSRSRTRRLRLRRRWDVPRSPRRHGGGDHRRPQAGLLDDDSASTAPTSPTSPTARHGDEIAAGRLNDDGMRLLLVSGAPPPRADRVAWPVVTKRRRRFGGVRRSLRAGSFLR